MAMRFETPWHGIGTGGSPALDFVNTLDWRLRAEPIELLTTPRDLLRFGWNVGAISLSEAQRLRSWCDRYPRRAAGSLRRARVLREALAELFEAVLLGSPLPSGALRLLESAWRAAVNARRLRSSEQELAWTLPVPAASPDQVAWVLALDAERLLTGPERRRVGRCADGECGWYFLDVSRNRSRRWCRMEGCGNRNKARAFYRRTAGREGRETKADTEKVKSREP